MTYPGLKSVFIRKTIRELEQQVIPRFLDIFPDGSVINWKESRKTVEWDNGARINFVSIESETDAGKEQGIERQLYVIDEAPLLPEAAIVKLKASLRNTRVKNWKSTLFATGNPGGVSDRYFKTYFIHKDYSRWTPQELKEKDQYLFIPATVYDNKILLEVQPEYVDQLDGLPEHMRRAWLDGDWDVFSGKFFEMWRESIHVRKNSFIIPDSWLRWRSIDLGKGSKAHPSVCLWLAQNPATGELVVYREFMHKGSPEEFAEGIRRLSGKEQYMFSYADPAMFAQDNSTYDASRIFLDKGVYIVPADNSRQLGWLVVKQWLNWAPPDETGKNGRMPKLTFFPEAQGCKESLGDLMYAKSGINDCDSRMFDDPADALRYALVKLPYSTIWAPSEDGKFEPRYTDIDMDVPYWDLEQIQEYAEFERRKAVSAVVSANVGEVIRVGGDELGGFDFENEPGLFDNIGDEQEGELYFPDDRFANFY